MKITVEKTDLAKCLSRLARVVERRNTIPILCNVLLEAGDGRLRLQATDLDLEISETIPASVLLAGATTVPATLLSDIVKKSADGSQIQLSMKEDGSQLVIASGRSTVRLQALPPQDFPNAMAIKATHAFTLPAADFARLFERTAFACSTEETRYYLNGVYLHIHDYSGIQRLRGVATDGHRLARTEIVAPDGSEGMPSIIIPRKAVGEIPKLCGDLKEDVSIEISDRHMRVKTDKIILSTKLVDGTYPDYQRVIPMREDSNALAVELKELGAAVNRVTSISLDRGRGISLAISSGSIVLKMRSPDAGDAIDEIDAHFQLGAEPLEIGFNGRYLAELCGHLVGGKALFMMTDPGSPARIIDDGDRASEYVLMPMRI